MHLAGTLNAITLQRYTLEIKHCGFIIISQMLIKYVQCTCQKIRLIYCPKLKSHCSNDMVK